MVHEFCGRRRNEKRGVLVAIHSVGRVHFGMHSCGVRSHVLGWVVSRARLKRLFPLKSSSIFKELQGVFRKFLMLLFGRIVSGIELFFCSDLFGFDLQRVLL